MLKQFYPNDMTESVYRINFKKLYKKGYQGILFDIDNTLVPHGAPADEQIKNLFQHLKKIGFHICLISNNQKKRVKSFADSVDVPYIENAHKPSVKNYRKAMDKIGTSRDNTIFVGDQLFTDIFGANRTGLYSILVQPIHPKEEIQIILKRYLEKLVLWHYQKEETDK